MERVKLKFSLRLKIFLAFLMITFITVLLVTLLVNQRFTAEMRKNLEISLSSAGDVYQTYSHNGVMRLIDQAGNVSVDVRLQAALSTGDTTTLRAAITEINLRRQANLLAVLNPRGELLAHVGMPLDPGFDTATEPAVIDALNGFLSGDVWAIDDTLLELAAVPVMTSSQLQGILVIGQQMNQSFLDALRQMTDCQLTFLVNGKVPFSTYYSGDRDATAQIFTALADRQGIYDFEAMGTRYLGTKINIINVKNDIIGALYIYKSLDKALASLGPLRISIFLIALGGIALSLLFSYVLAGGVTKPVEILERSIRKFGEGATDIEVNAVSRDEVGALARAFEEMRLSLLSAQFELVKQERLSAIGSMANGIIHDFKQPINSIQGFADLLRLPNIDDSKRQRFSDLILTSIDHMMEMINDLLDFSRGITELALEPTDLNSLVLEIVAPLKAELADKNISFNFEQGAVGTIPLDRHRFKRVVKNLIGNARDAVNSDGAVTLATVAVDAGVTLNVKDTGPGIPAEIQATLFDPFVTSGKSQGTGLGLAISKKIVEEHGGRITFSTKLSEGTEFSVWLPQK